MTRWTDLHRHRGRSRWEPARWLCAVALAGLGVCWPGDSEAYFNCEPSRTLFFREKALVSPHVVLGYALRRHKDHTEFRITRVLKGSDPPRSSLMVQSPITVLRPGRTYLLALDASWQLLRGNEHQVAADEGNPVSELRDGCVLKFEESGEAVPVTEAIRQIQRYEEPTGSRFQGGTLRAERPTDSARCWRLGQKQAAKELSEVPSWPEIMRVRKDVESRSSECGRGIVIVDITVRKDGTVTQANLRTKDQPVAEACIKKAFLAARFPRFDGPPMEVALPLILGPREPRQPTQLSPCGQDAPCSAPPQATPP